MSSPETPAPAGTSEGLCPARAPWRRPALAALALLVIASGLVWTLGLGPDGRTRVPARASEPATPVPAVEPASMGTGFANIDLYRGLGTWIDIYDFASWDRPRATVRAMAARGIRTLYIETSNFRRTRPFVFKSGLVTFVNTAHAYGMKVVAWYLPGFVNNDTDFQRMSRAIAFTTDRGESFDSLAIDIESPENPDPDSRTANLIDLSSRLRAFAGDDYPLGAIVPSPRGMLKHADYWPGFPWAELHATYDVFLPMTYFTWRVSGLDGAHSYTVDNIEIIREQTGDASAPIHVIGGISNEATTRETRGFVRAIRERGAIGASYYGFPGTTSVQWSELSAVPVNPTQVPSMPVQVGSYAEALGNVPGVETTHPREVFFRSRGNTGAYELYFEAFDAQKHELQIWVNWHFVGMVYRTADGEWSGPRTRSISDELWNEDRPNYVAFVAPGNFPSWSTWGVRNVSVAPAPVPSPTPTA